jgi:hypothetical protein
MLFYFPKTTEPWNKVGALKNSLSDVQQFCFRLVAELDMGYESPPLPVHMEGSSLTAFQDMFSTAQRNSSQSNLNIPPSLNTPAVPDTPGSISSNPLYTTPNRDDVEPDFAED